MLNSVRLRRARTRFYSQFVKSGDVVFDIGANIGNRVEVFRALGAKVIAVEPQSGCVKALQQRFGDDPETTILGIGLGEQEGMAQLHLASEEAGHVFSSMSPEWIDSMVASGIFRSHEEWPDVQDVPVSTLDALIAEYGLPAFVKIDVEGFESSVLRGLSRPLSALSFEWHRRFEEGPRSCLKLLNELGDYRYRITVAEEMNWATPWLNAHSVESAIAGLAPYGEWGDVYAHALRP